jgi:class 3 adenylate cyclase
MEISDWLREIGLPQYIELFRSNDVDSELLRQLTSDDLKELGVSSFGHRKRLIEAAALGESTPLASRTQPSTTAVRSRCPAAERRQLTVLFCDLVGSTELSSSLDPEDLRVVMRHYQDTCVDIVSRYEGAVANFLGDGVLAYFGFPVAHEDDAERAVRAGLEIAAIVGRQSVAGAFLAARVGIATGLVVVGEIDGPGDATSVVGGTPNLAARLQTEAKPGGVVVAPLTRRLAGEWFAYRDLGLRSLKGFAQPVAIAEVLGERSTESRFAAIRAARLTPFVGRDEEMNLMLDRWRKAKGGEGQVVLLSGEAGIGKSRLVETLCQLVDPVGIQPVRFQCSPHHAASALYPVISQLRIAAAIEPNDAPEDKLAKVERVVEPSSVPLLAALLGIPTEGLYPPIDVTPTLQKAQTLRAVVDQLLRRADHQPLLVLMEDVHWIDPTTLELLDLLIPLIARARVLLVVTARPEFQNLWSDHAHMTALTMNRLSQEHCFDLIAGMTKGAEISPEVARVIAARADGVPLFIEELTKSVLESDTQPAEMVPVTLQDLLLARLDRLSAAKEVAQLGAAIGREFDYSLIASVTELPQPMLNEALQEVEAAGLIFRQGEPPAASYRFKHALVQDAAHGSLLRGRRQQLHARIAAAIESDHAEFAANHPELLAQHFAEAGLAEQSTRHWLAAGRLATSRSSTQEAVMHFTRGIETLAEVAAGDIRDSLELDLQIGLASATIANKGYAADETETAYSRAIELLRARPADPRQIAARYGLFVVRWNRADLGGAAALAQEMLGRAIETADTAALCVSHRALAVSYNPMARFCEARDHATAAVSYFDPVVHRDLGNQYGHDIGVAALIHLMTAEAFLGMRQQAEAAMERAFQLAERLSHPNTLAYAHGWSAFRLLVERDMPRAAAMAAKMVTQADKYGLPFWLALGRCLHGAALVGSDPYHALCLIEAGQAGREAILARLYNSMLLCAKAEALLGLNRIQDAHAALDRSDDHSARTGELWWAPEVHRIRAAAIRVEGGHHALVRAELARATKLAEAQESETFRRRAMTELEAIAQARS